MDLVCSPLDGWPIECMCSYSKGFIAAGEDGKIYFYERSQEEPKTIYGDKPYKELKVSKNQKKLQNIKIKSISISPQPSEDHLIISTENNQI